MGKPIRRTSKRTATTPEALAEHLPVELRSLAGVDSLGDYRVLSHHITDWLNHAAPGHGHELAAPVMNAAGLSAADFYRKVLT